jgi:outer membrane protein assembly factor BamB
MDQYVSPVPVDANGDGVEDIAGAFILDERNSLNAYVGVIDGRTWSVLWKDGPFGNREKATRSTGVGVREGRMLAVNALGDGTVYDLATGAKKLSFSFDAKYPAMSVCAPAEGPYVYLHFNPSLRVDLKALLVKPMPTPRECERERRHRDDTGDVWRRMAINHPGDAPKLERFDGQSWLHDGSHGVVLGTPRGSDAAELVGFDPVTHLETWRKPLAALAPGAVGHKAQGLELAEGRFFFTYSADEEHVVSVDAATGERQWEAVSPGASVMNLTVSPTRLYLVTLEWQALPVNVLDIRTGGLIARLGGAASRY